MSEPFPMPFIGNIFLPEWLQPFNPLFYDENRATEGYRRKLPHWRYEGASYFLTFRLHDSLPRAVAEALHKEAAEWETRLASERAAMDGRLSATTRKAYEDFQREHFVKLETFLDECHGSCLLRDAAKRRIVHDAILYFQDERCRMAAFVIMPNHVHALCQPMPGWPLEDLVGSWKKHTAEKINVRLGQRGRFWQPETHDRIIRDGEHFRRSVRYIARNPPKAGLTRDEAEVWLSGEIIGKESIP